MVHGWLDFSGSKQLEIIYAKVANANIPRCLVKFRAAENWEYRKGALCQAPCVDRFHLGPKSGDVALGETWRVNQIQIDI